MKVKSEKQKVKRAVAVVVLVAVVSLGSGCEAFVKKFRRKPREESREQKELVLEPESYDNLQVSKEELARQYYLFWGSWHDELIQSLASSTNHKKQIETAYEAALSLSNLALLVTDDHKQALQEYHRRLIELHDAISRDIHGMYRERDLRSAQRLKREISRSFPARRLHEFILREEPAQE